MLPLAILAFVCVLGAYFYVRAQTLMAEQLRERLQSTASVAAAQIDATDIAAIHSIDDRGSDAYRHVVQHLQRIRSMTPGARYVYVVRATEDPSFVSFIADADEFTPDAMLDRDRSGIVDDDEAPAMPGELYDISDMDKFRAGFDAPSVDVSVTYDRWGALISGYAPIRTVTGQTLAVLGIDMSADEFLGTTRSIFSPVAFLFVLIAGVLLASFSFSIVQRRRLESLQQLESERSAMLDLATHQLGMPLATFRWWLELLRDRGSTVEGETEAYDQLQLGVDRMDHIVRSLQDAARLQSDEVRYDAEPIQPVSFVQDVLRSMQSAFDVKRQRVEVITDGVVPSFMIDRTLMMGVLAEILENARGYSPAGSVITIRLSQNTSMVRIEVEDRGCGIPADQLPRLFQKFTRGTNASAHKPVGSGLGLYICKGIVERGGGRLSLQSVEGVGTTVRLELPIAL